VSSKATFLVLMVALAATLPAATLVHDYQLNGSLTDALSGPALVSLGGTVGGSGYTFPANQGLSLSGPSLGPGYNNYTIEMSFSFDSTGGYRRILDFLNRTSDSGLYNLNTAMNFYTQTSGPSGAFTAGEMSHLVVTRDAGGTFTGYVDAGSADHLHRFGQCGGVQRAVQHHLLLHRR
jgi:hypothetical protein